MPSSGEKTADSVVRNLEIIGEAANRLPQEIRDHHVEVPWSRGGGFEVRDALVPGSVSGTRFEPHGILSWENGREQGTSSAANRHDHSRFGGSLGRPRIS